MNKKLNALFNKAANKKAADSRSAAPARPGGSGFVRLADLYARMEDAYRSAASRAGLSCAGCEQNCCTGYFQHHTHIEWAYLWRGLNQLPQTRQDAVRERAQNYVRDARAALVAGAPPATMCPLNDQGLCSLYQHRLMICRMHGTRNILTMPDGAVRSFSGCYRFVALQKDAGAEAPFLDRTPFYRELAALETEFRRGASCALPRVDMTIAEMIVLGPPKFR